ncbi:MAG: hypothetical protein ACRDYX_05220 [Egibacteraceae bacterium]
MILDLTLVRGVLAVGFGESFAVSAPSQRQADVHVEHLEAIQAQSVDDTRDGGAGPVAEDLLGLVNHVPRVDHREGGHAGP